MTSIHLGFEVGTGRPVDIPLLNMCITGQTQQSGKTTTLEALVHRAEIKALAFVTKRGEGSFAGGRRVQPYFRERADWQFVDQLLSAVMNEKNRPLRSFLIRICRSTKTLQDVQFAARRALKSKATRGFARDVYTQLDAYLDLVIPEVQNADLASTLELRPGLSVMDVSGSSLAMQMLFVQSAIDWVNEKERDTVVVIPEAWEMVPEGRGSPVKASAISLVRKGSALQNHIWLDSQDMAGVDKVLLRGCPVWLIGVQREANEIKRALSNIPDSISKPKAKDVATLERGQFFACWGHHAVRTYVQPAWMAPSTACSWAQGLHDNLPIAPPRPTPQEEQVNEQEARALRAENDKLRDKIGALENELARLHGAGQPKRPREESTPAPVKYQANGHSAPVAAVDEDGLYERFLSRLRSEDPKVLRIAITKPEMEVTIRRETVTAKGSTWVGFVALLISEGFFESPRMSIDAFREGERRGMSGISTRAYEACEKLLVMGFLTNEGKGIGYQAVAAMKVNIVEG